MLMVSCPQWHLENDSYALECRHCGIVFDKYSDYLTHLAKRKEIETKGANRIKKRINEQIQNSI